VIGAKHLESMRHAGKRPPGFVVLTESKFIAKNARNRELYPLIFDPEKTQDWRIIHGLWVGLVTYLPREKVAPICQEILNAGPSCFGITYLGYKEIEHERVVSAIR
jgi:hypothetical protein